MHRTYMSSFFFNFASTAKEELPVFFKPRRLPCGFDSIRRYFVFFNTHRIQSLHNSCPQSAISSLKSACAHTLRYCIAQLTSHELKGKFESILSPGPDQTLWGTVLRTSDPCLEPVLTAGEPQHPFLSAGSSSSRRSGGKH